MRTRDLVALTVWGALTAGFAAELDAGQMVDYLKLTRANLPHVKLLQKATLENLDFNKETLEQVRRRIRASALLPYAVSLGYSVDDDARNEYGLYDKKTTYDDTGGSSQFTTFNQVYGSLPNEYTDYNTISLSATWDLADLFGRNIYETYLVGDTINQKDQEAFVIVEVAKCYGKLIAALPTKAGGRISPAKVLVIYENAAILDSMSGLLITDALRADAGMSSTITPDGEELKQKIKEAEASLEDRDAPIAEVPDGQDDDVEIIGGSVNEQ